MEPHAEAIAIGKRFGGVRALEDVSLSVARGEIHGLVGENGAGKSTLGKIIAGVYTADAGELRIAGRSVHYRSPREALRDGVTIIAQEIALVPELSVLGNVYLGLETGRHGLLDEGALRDRYARLVERAGFDLPGDVPVGVLRLADRQKVEILRALARNAELIVMDEPTAALPADDAEKLFAVIRGLKERGTTIVYVSHFLEEVLALCDTVSVLKDGRLVRSSPTVEERSSSLVAAMLGRSQGLAFPEKSYPPGDAPVVLTVRDLACGGFVRGVSFDVRAGEIVGLAGLVGSGRSEVARAIFGAERREGGRVELDGRPLDVRSPHGAVQAGLAMVPESRKEQGLIMERSVIENVTLPHLGSVSRAGVVSSARELARTEELINDVDIRTERPQARVLTLSGGNQQKVLFAKWLSRRPRLLIADEPTRGIDVGAKRAVYELLHSLAASGIPVLLISSEHEEVIGLAHRVLVMRQGQLVSHFDGRTVTEDEVLAAAFATAGEAA
jgi:ABC-type sugar transport system ATPase subunit